MAQRKIDMLLKTERVQKSIKRLRKYFKKNPKSPTPAKIHDLRTSARRLESSLESMDIGKKKLKKRIERDLSVVRKRLGKVRDMDVLTAHAMSVSPKITEQESLVELLEYLGAERSGHIKKLRKTAKRYGPPLRKELRKIAEKVDDTANDRKQNGERAVGFNEQQAGPLRELMEGLERPTHLTRSNLHPYRLKLKELRYVLQLAEQKAAEKLVEELGRVKDAIGEWHDWEELLAVASEVVDDGPRSKLVVQLKQIAEKEFEKALALAKQMRRKYRRSSAALSIARRLES
jgi:CHAD domain-containing protein